MGRGEKVVFFFFSCIASFFCCLQKASFNDGKPVDFVGRKASPHSVAGLLKAWLRELPEPLLTYGMFEQWMRIATKTIVKGMKRKKRGGKKRKKKKERKRERERER